MERRLKNVCTSLYRLVIEKEALVIDSIQMVDERWVWNNWWICTLDEENKKLEEKIIEMVQRIC